MIHCLSTTKMYKLRTTVLAVEINGYLNCGYCNIKKVQCKKYF